MSFGDGIAAVQVEREEKHGKFWACVLLLRDFMVITAVLLTFLGTGVAIIQTLVDWTSGTDTLVHVIYMKLAWFWNLFGRIV
jgi:hypothetical protein